jgi:hypothetical protein
MTTDEPGIAMQAPQSAEISAYDEAHFVTYLRLLDASAAGASEEEMCRLILSHENPVAKILGQPACHFRSV